MRIPAWALCLSLAASASWAQDGTLRLAPSPVVECLTPTADARGRPEYPELAYLLKEAGTIQVELTFTTADGAPDVKILSSSGPSSLVDAVSAHVKRFRVPCLRAGQPPARLRQDYVFIPNDGRKVTWTSPMDANDQVRDEARKCITHVRGLKLPTYPLRSQRLESEGTVILRMRFAGPDQPPVLTTLDPGLHPALEGAAEAFAHGYRLPCMTGEPLELDSLFTFRIEGNEIALLRDASLVSFLRGVRDLTRQPVYFDFSTMGCPFDLKLRYLRPFVANHIGEVETPHPARLPFLDWLTGLALNLNAKDNNAILGNTMTLHVPCGTLDL